MRLIFSAGLSLTIACGGSVADPIEGGSADSTTDVRADVADTGLPDVPAVDCPALEAKLAAMRMQILTCCPFCNSLQCSHVTQDVCCPISTTATAVSEFEGTVAQFKAQCHPACPAIPCPMVPSNVCMPGSNPNAPGTCK